MTDTRQRHHDAPVFDVALDWAFPDLGKRVVPVGGRVDLHSEHSSGTEYDTAGHDLSSFGALLVRTGGSNGVWTLHLEGAVTTLPAQGRTVPQELRDVLLGVRAGAALRPVRRVESERTTRLVVGADGAQLGEVTDVHEHTAEISNQAPMAVSEQRRVEVSGWDGPFATTVRRALTKAGATPVESRAEPDTDGTVGAVVQAFLHAEHDEILKGDLRLRRGADAIHSSRVTIRRLRSVLRVVDVADPDRVAALDTELKWLSGLLGEVRDRDVLRGHLRDAVNALGGDAPGGGVLAAAAELVDTVLAEEQAVARAELSTAMAGRRYVALLHTLREWRTDPQFTADAARPQERLAGYLRTASKQLDKRLARAEDTIEGLHRARKAAKRARYVSEFAAPVLGKQAGDLGKRAKQLQQLLGEHQDSVVASDFLDRIALRAHGAAAFGCGILWAYERDRAGRDHRRALG